MTEPFKRYLELRRALFLKKDEVSALEGQMEVLWGKFNDAEIKLAIDLRVARDSK